MNTLETLWLKRRLDEIEQLQNAMILQQKFLGSSLDTLNSESKVLLAKINELEAYVDKDVIPTLEAQIVKAGRMAGAIDSKVPDA